MKFKKGDLVEQVMPAPIKGVVSGFSLCQETGEVFVIVDTLDAEGVIESSRQFKEDEVQAQPTE